MDLINQNRIKTVLNRIKEHNKYSGKLPSEQKNTSGQRRMRRSIIEQMANENMELMNSIYREEDYQD